MDDREIIKLFYERSEQGVVELSKKYGRLCRKVAQNILQNDSDAEECVNDAYMRLWNSIPPEKPERLGLYLGKVVRNLALNRLKAFGAAKRGGGQYPVALEELMQVTASRDRVEDVMENKRLSALLEQFVRRLPSEKRVIFLLRYWYFKPVGEIASSLGLTANKVKVTLSRTRKELKAFLEKEEIAL